MAVWVEPNWAGLVLMTYPDVFFDDAAGQCPLMRAWCTRRDSSRGAWENRRWEDRAAPGAPDRRQVERQTGCGAPPAVSGGRVASL